MELIFEHNANLGSGVNPAAIHLPDNSVWLFHVSDGRLNAKEWKPDPGDVPWAMPVFGANQIATKDKNLSLYRMKNVPRVGMFGAWHQDAVMDGETVITPERQRFAIWDALNDITNYLESGEIRMDLDNIVSSASFTFKNPSQHLSGETNSRMTPGNKIELFFTAGDSEDYPMGVFYCDRIDMTAAGETITVDCRNISGKLLKDQTFDANNSYLILPYSDTVEALLDNAGITDYDIQPSVGETPWSLGLEFPPDMDMLTGFLEMIGISLNWVARETLDGQIIAGSTVTYQPIIDLNSKYTFNRGTDLFRRGVTRDDNDVYSRVCYQSKQSATETTPETTIRAYANVLHAFEWAYAPNKTLYLTAPDDTVLAELQDLADALASRMAYSGIIEQFSGPFRPHIIPGDEAEIVADDGTHLLGLITTVSHSFGQNGFSTSFTVDSAGVLGKPQLRDLIEKVSGKGQTSSNIKRLY